MNIWLDLNR